MSLFDSASLVVTPNGYKAGKLYSIKPTSGAGDLDVVRATSATRVNASGLIEIPRTNLLLRSEEFDNNAWSKLAGASIVTNTIISPSGTMTADTLNFDTQISSRVEQSISLTTLGSYTFSFYAKSDSLKTVGIRTGISGSATINVQVTTEWQRFSVTQTLSVAGLAYPQIRSIDALGGSIYVWGAQLEIGNVATEYIPTTSVIRTRFAGITQDGGSANNIPRLDYTNASCPSILVEPQRTNLFLRSEEFDNASWNKTSGSTPVITQNSILSPSGTMTADTITPNNTLSTHWIGRTGFTLVSGTTYAFSVFAKNNGYNLVLSVGSSTVYTNCNFNLNNGTASTPLATSGANLCSPLIQDFGNGWYRCTIIFTAWTASNALLYSANNTTSTPVGAFGMATITGNNANGFFLWGAQLEAGANATSYIPTQASTVTRNADVISKTGVSSLIGQSEGTLFIEIDINTIETKGILDISADIGNFYRIRTASNGQFLFRYRTGGGAETTIASLSVSNSQTGIFKIAFAYKNGDYASCVNGVLRTSNISGISPIGSISEVFIGVNPLSLNDRVNSVMIFKERLTNEQCIALTTL